MMSILFLAAAALAQGVDTHRPLIPSAGIATEDGPGGLWVNPANLAYDQDLRYGVFFGREVADDLSSVGATIGIDGLGIGLHNRLRRAPQGALRSDWSLDYGTSIPLPERLAVGLLLSWNFVDTGTNYLAYDAGVSWRPLPWLGVSGVAQNVGSPDPAGIAQPRSGAGIAFRPLGRAAILGVDYARLFATSPADPDGDVDAGVATLRLRPVEGLYLRGSAEARVIDGEVAPIRLGAGIELYMGGLGIGGHLDGDLEQPARQVGWIGTDEPGESLLRSGRHVPELELSRAPAYVPRASIFGDPGLSWLDTLELLRRAEDDRGVRGLVLTLDGASMSLARFRELRSRVESLEASGKPVLVYLTSGAGNGDMYVASAASRIALHPATDVELVGLSVTLTHLRGLLDLVGVEPQFVKRAKYKTSPETFTHPEPTPANVEMQEALLDDLFAELVRGVAEGRGVDEAKVRGWIDSGPHSASEALEAGIVDVLLYPDELDEELDQLHGGPVAGGDLRRAPQPHSPWEDPKQLAIVYVDGPIVTGESSRGGLLSAKTSGSDTVVRALDRARLDPQVRAVVMRVDSPGGSSLASDEIWRAVTRLQKTGKPVVVSMGGVAASGGYYVSASADAIWAEPETLTGSIGVYSGKFSTGELRDAVGVGTTFLSRGRNATIYSSARPWDDVQRARMQALVDETYEQFKERVGDGRELEAEEVEDVARGRVWSGVQAKQIGLIDELGGFQEAIADARERAGLPENSKVGLITYSDGGSVLDSLAPALAGRVLGPLRRVVTVPSHTPKVLEELDVWLDPVDPLLVPALHPQEHVWMMAPWSMEIGPR